MSTASQPLVSIVTPVYNGAEYLAECVESVLAQTYSDWDYTIVNNCSTDESLAIAQKYAAKEPRIRVVSSDRFLRIIENHNLAIRQISPDSKYCKFVFADDWLFPTCIEEMVRIAQQHPSVGLVGAYTTDGKAVIWQGLSYPAHRVPGREVCRSMLLGGPYVLGTMTSLLVRAELIRKRAIFFNEQNLNADFEACFDVLQESDYGFVHQVLSFSRPQEHSTGSFANDFETIIVGFVGVFLKYGPVVLGEGEYRRAWKELHRQYHRVLANNLLRIRPKEFWDYHQDTLAAFGGKIDRWSLATALIPELATRLLHPGHALRRGRRWWSQALRRLLGNGRVQAQKIP